ncbi:MAG TPA: multicopper oxidase domain-containing protein [Vicinamibacterales bacterium]|nr:multicopper oxidase domain-containing protein [Vicinamibacterales bacterium]
MTAGGALLARCSRPATTTTSSAQPQPVAGSGSIATAKADYTLHIRDSAIELAPDRIVGVTSYEGRFPGPLLRLKEGQPVAIDIINETETPEQLHWHGQSVSTDVDGAAEEGTPFIPAHGTRRIMFTPQPAGFRFYHTHLRAGANLAMGQYGGQVGPVYIEPTREPGQYDREVFLVLKEFEPMFSRGGDVALDFLPPAEVPELSSRGEAAMKASLAKGMSHGYEVGYGSFTINGRMLGHGDPVRVNAGERVLFHVLNGSATEIRSLALPGHTFRVIALDGNPVPNPTDVPVLWIGTGERVSAIVEMTRPGVWILGDLSDDDRQHGMGVVVEYAGRSGKAQWMAPPRSRWDYLQFAKPGATAATADETIEMTFAKDNAAEDGFNRWTINGAAYPMTQQPAPASVRLTRGRRYRIRMRNESDDIHPIHLHRHTFELVSLGGRQTGGILKDVLMLGGYQEAEVQFVADNPGLTLFHCHQQLHMDFGFMTLFQYA